MLKHTLTVCFVTTILTTCMIAATGCTYHESDDDCDWCNHPWDDEYDERYEYITYYDGYYTYEECEALNLDCDFLLSECEAADCPMVDTCVDSASDVGSDAISDTDSETAAPDTGESDTDTNRADTDTVTTDTDKSEAKRS